MNQKVRLQSTARQMYGKRAVKSGEIFEADNEKDAADLVAVGFARRVKFEPGVVPTPTYETRQSTAAVVDGGAGEAEVPTVGRSSRYLRRDLRPKS